MSTHTYSAQLAENIQVASACGLSPKAIAKEFDLPLSTLTSLYRDDLEHGLEVANAKIAKVFFDLALSGEHPQLTKSWMELRGGWTPSSSLTLNDSQDAEVAREKLLKLLNRSATPLKAVK